MNRIKTFCIVLTLLAITISGCKKDEPGSSTPAPTGTTETTVAEDKQHITASFDQMNACTDEVINGQLVSLVKTIFQINQGNSADPDWLFTIMDSLPSIFDIEQIEAVESFDLSYHTGVYAYNKASGTWGKTAASDGSMAIQFPSTDGGDNDLELLISGYADETHTFDGETIKLPTSLSLIFTQSGTTLVELSLVSAQYEELPTVTIPIYVDVDIILAPLTIDITARKVNATKFDLNVSVTNSGSCGIAVYSEVNLLSSDYENLMEEDVESIISSITFNNLKITSNIDFNTLSAINDPTYEQINSLTDVDVLYLGAKIGELNLVEVGTDDEVHMVYKDGTSEAAEDAYLVPLLDDLEITLFDLIGNW